MGDAAIPGTQGVLGSAKARLLRLRKQARNDKKRKAHNDKEGKRPHNDKKEDAFLFANEKIGLTIILFPVL